MKKQPPFTKSYEIATKQKEVQGFLTELITEFMHCVKSQKENDPNGEVIVDAKFKELDTQWRIKCKTRDCRLLQLRNDCFGVAIGLIVADQQNNKVEAGAEIISLEDHNKIITL